MNEGVENMDNNGPDYQAINEKTLEAYLLAEEGGDEFLEYLLSVVLAELSDRLKASKPAKAGKVRKSSP